MDVVETVVTLICRNANCASY